MFTQVCACVYTKRHAVLEMSQQDLDMGREIMISKRFAMIFTFDQEPDGSRSLLVWSITQVWLNDRYIWSGYVFYTSTMTLTFDLYLKSPHFYQKALYDLIKYKTDCNKRRKNNLYISDVGVNRQNNHLIWCP